jgi:helix-turn-helix protein
VGAAIVYRDFGRPNAGLEQARAIIAAKIINILDERKLSTRDAEKLTGVSHSEFTR